MGDAEGTASGAAGGGPGGEGVVAVGLSVVSPAHNEEENVDALVREVHGAVSPFASASGMEWEFIVVDDGSTDGTRGKLLALAATRPWLRVVVMTRTPAGKGAGQSAAFHAGFRAARGALVATLDADLQNDPGDIPRLVSLLRDQGVDMVQGDRSRNRRDNIVRRAGSVVGRRFRGWILGDRVRDTGCSLRVMKREIAVALPLEFRGMHRFIPATASAMGYRVIETAVSHRPRVAGETKYGLGIVQRALPGLMDCFAVRWMTGRRRWTDAREATPGPGAARAESGAALSRSAGEGVGR